MQQSREAILSLGSNQGDRLSGLNRTCAALDAWPGIHVLDCSPVYETEPFGVPPAFANTLFLNQVVIVGTTLAPATFSYAIHTLEEHLGRTRGTPGQPRVIDIDIIAFGDLLLDTPELMLPHPRTRMRRFVLQPLADLRPDFVLPGDTQTVSDLLHTLAPTPRVARFPVSGQDEHFTTRSACRC